MVENRSLAEIERRNYDFDDYDENDNKAMVMMMTQ